MTISEAAFLPHAQTATGAYAPTPRPTTDSGEAVRTFNGRYEPTMARRRAAAVIVLGCAAGSAAIGLAGVLGYVLVLSLALLFGYVFATPWVVDRSIRFFPVLATTWATLLVSIAALLVQPSGWVSLLCSPGSAGAITRLLLPSAIAVPLLTALAANSHRSGAFLSSGGLTIIVAINMAFAAALILGGGWILQRREERAERLQGAQGEQQC